MPKSWYSFKAAAAGSDTAELSVFDYIGYYGVNAIDFIRDLKAVQAPNINVTINSPGGDVFDAIAMVNALRASGKKIKTQVLGIAASAASYLMLAGDKRSMPSNTMQMVHNASTGAYGNAEELKNVVDALNKVDENLHATYASRTGLSAEKVTELLSKDTYLTAAECLELGLVDEVTDAIKVTASYEVDRLPENVQALFKAAQTNPASSLTEQVVALAKASGFEAFAPTFATDPAITSLAEAEAVIARAREVKALAEAVGHADQADGLIRGRKTVIEARAVLNTLLVNADEKTRVDTATKSKTTNQAGNDDDWNPTKQWVEIKAMKAGSTK